MSKSDLAIKIAIARGWPIVSLELPVHPDTVLPTQNTCAVKRSMDGKDMSSKNSVRCYRYSPDTLCLQIRCQSQYASVNLTDAEAIKLARMILGRVDLIGDTLASVICDLQRKETKDE